MCRTTLTAVRFKFSYNNVYIYGSYYVSVRKYYYSACTTSMTMRYDA